MSYKIRSSAQREDKVQEVGPKVVAVDTDQALEIGSTAREIPYLRLVGILKLTIRRTPFLKISISNLLPWSNKINLCWPQYLTR